jgi:hypothetical protein
MIVTYKLSVDVDDVSFEELSEVIATVMEMGRGYTAPDHGGVELTARQREQLAGLLSGEDPLDGGGASAPPQQFIRVDGSTGDSLDGVYTGNGQSSGRVTDHLELVDLDDDDALARIAFDAYVIAEGGSYSVWEKAETQEAWRAAAAAVKTAALLQQANRAVADA